MCVRVFNRDSGEDTETPPGLRAMIGADLVVDPAYKGINDDACLCQVDVRESVIRAGFDCEYDRGDYIISERHR